MSLILDALRKIELERKARRQGSQQVRAEVLNYHGAAAVSEKPSVMMIVAVLAFISAAAVCVFYFTKTESPGSDSAKTAEPPKQEQQTVIRPVSLQPPPAAPPIQKNIPAEAKSSPETARPETRKAVVTKLSGDEGITVSGIAWQDERYLRRAVINGSLVGEGAEILGAKVVEIRDNRIRFSRDGEFFEVLHSSGSGR